MTGVQLLAVGVRHFAHMLRWVPAVHEGSDVRHVRISASGADDMEITTPAVAEVEYQGGYTLGLAGRRVSCTQRRGATASTILTHRHV